MADNAFASIAAATAAGWSLERTTTVGAQAGLGPTTDAVRNISRLKLKIVGQPGNAGSEVVLQGEGASSGAADTAALASCNFFRKNRYGGDSTAANISTIQTPPAFGSHKAQDGTTHASLTKDKH